MEADRMGIKSDKVSFSQLKVFLRLLSEDPVKAEEFARLCRVNMNEPYYDALGDLVATGADLSKVNLDDVI